MNRNFKRITKAGVVIIVWLASQVYPAQAQVPFRLNDKEVESLLKRIEENSDKFRKSFDHSLDKSHVSGKEKDQMKRYVKDFENATDHLKDRFNKKNSASGDVEEVLHRAERINDFMTRDVLESRAQEDWMNLRGNLDELANAYNVSWRWNGRYSRESRGDHENIGLLLDRSGRDSDRFRDSLAGALDRGGLEDGTGAEHIDRHVMDLQSSIDRLQDRYKSNGLASSEIIDVLLQSVRIDRFMMSNSLDYRSQNDWGALRHDFEQIAQAYDVAWKW